MPRPAGTPATGHPGLVGLYALTMMEKDGPVHGYGVAERISERTEGSWRPGPGAVYPSLQRIMERGWARGRLEGRRRIYEITPEGRRFLGKLRERRASMSTRLDLAVLWSEVMGSANLDAFLLRRLRSTLDALDRRFTRNEGPGPVDGAFRSEVERSMAESLARWSAPNPRTIRRARRSAA